MPLKTSANNFCNKIQARFMPFGEEVSKFKSPAGLLQALMSQTNMPTPVEYQTAFDAGNGRRVAVYENYWQRPTGATTVGDIPDVCVEATPDAEHTRQVEFIEAQDLVSTKFTIKNEQFRMMCEPEMNDASYMVLETMERYLDSHYRKINEKLITDFDTIRGNFSDGTTAIKNAALYKANLVNGSISDGIATIINEYQSLDAPVLTPFIVGAGLMNKYALAADVGCCLSDAGFDVSKATREVIYVRDSDVGKVLADDDLLLTWIPQTVVPITYNYFTDNFALNRLGEDIMNPANVIRTTFADGSSFQNLMTHDLEIGYKGCTRTDEGWTVAISTSIKLLTIPDDAFALTDPLNGVNWALAFKAINEPALP